MNIVCSWESQCVRYLACLSVRYRMDTLPIHVSCRKPFILTTCWFHLFKPFFSRFIFACFCILFLRQLKINQGAYRNWWEDETFLICVQNREHQCALQSLSKPLLLPEALAPHNVISPDRKLLFMLLFKTMQCSKLFHTVELFTQLFGVNAIRWQSLFACKSFFHLKFKYKSN